jgi:hypothetical protein
VAGGWRKPHSVGLRISILQFNITSMIKSKSEDVGVLKDITNSVELSPS